MKRSTRPRWHQLYTNQSQAGKLSVALTPDRERLMIMVDDAKVMVPRWLIPRLRQALEAIEEIE